LTSDAATAGLRAEAAIEAARARPSGIWVGRRRFELAPHHCFACGELNEHGLRLALHGDDAGCWTELVLEPRFEGWQGIAHGGILATATSTFVAATGAQREALAARYGIATSGGVDR